MTAIILQAEHPRGMLFAAVDGSVRFTTAAVAHSRFGAMFTPFTSEEAAREALAAAGGGPAEVWKGQERVK